MVYKETAIIASLVIVAAVSSLALGTTILAGNEDQLMTFWVSFCVGTGGAGVYLLLTLMIEKDMAILKNRYINNLTVMAFFYLLSGGFVAAVTQTSVGILTSSDLHAVFIVGFGWQGAMSGIAGASSRVQLAEDASDKTIDADRAKQKGEALIRIKEKKIEEMRATITELRKKLGGKG